MKLISLLAALTSFFISYVAHADKWTAATPVISSSSNATLIVRITPGNSVGDVNGFEGAPKGQMASASWFKFDGENYQFSHQYELPIPIAPVDVAVLNDGVLVTFDNWHNVGIGKVIRVFAADGVEMASFELADIYSKKEQKRFKRSASSYWWRKGGISVSDHDAQVHFSDCAGNYVSLSTQTLEVKKSKYGNAGCD
mgnify:CR=1 FL=1